MVYVDVVRWSTPTEGIDEEQVRQPANYFIDKIIERDNDRFEQLGYDSIIQERVLNVAKTQLELDLEKMRAVLGDFEGGTILDRFFDYKRLRISRDYRFISRDYRIYSISPERALLIVGGQGRVALVGSVKTDVEGIAKYITQEIKELASVSKDFGLVLSEIVSGKEYAMRSLKLNKNISETKQGEPKNELEKEVFSAVDSIANTSLHNLEIAFTEPTETFEYDSLVMLPTGAIDIEAKDYETIKDGPKENSETLKSKVILNPLDKARRLDAVTAIVTRGFSRQTFDNMKEFAGSRRIIFLEENNFKVEIEKIVLKRVLAMVGGVGSDS